MTRALLVVIGLLLLAGSCFAEPNSGARVRAFARLPDWTGLWQSEIARLGSNPSGHVEGAKDDADELSHSKLFGHPPLQPEWEQKYQLVTHDTAAAAAAAAISKECVPTGFPMMMDWFAMFQVVVTPEETLFVFENGAVRHVYTDGRSHPGADDLSPTRFGDSIGRWDGETLVIDTVGRAPGPVLLSPAVMLSDGAHFTEQVRRVGKNTLEDQMTIDDPLRFTHPWRLTIVYSRVTAVDRMDAWDTDCRNDRNPVVNGTLTIAPP